MAKLKCIIPEYFDRELECYIKQDEIIEVKNKKRIAYLISLGFVEEIKEDN